MLRLNVKQAMVGMELALPVFHPENAGVTLLKPGHALNEHTLRGLRELKVRELWIRYPALESLRQFVSEEVAAGCRELARRIAGTFDALVVDRHARLDFAQFRDASGSVVSALSKSPTAALYIMEMAEARTAPVRHAANVCFISLLIGLKLGPYLERERRRLSPWAARDISALGVGALLHDIGMVELDDATLARWEEAGDEQDDAFRAHAHLGFDMLHAAGAEIDATAAAIVLHHHQRWDGSGFPTRVGTDGKPRGLVGRETHVFARIAAAADIFDRLRFGRQGSRTAREDSPPVPTVRVLKQLLQSPWREKLDPVVLRALLSVAPAYPPGSFVTLSNAQSGAVVDWSPLDPCRPIVEVLDVTTWRRSNDALRVRINLRKRTDLKIVEIDGMDVSEDNFYPASERAFDVGAAARRADGPVAKSPDPGSNGLALAG